jgi:secondary thiamine-phosphate synthase enzyme
MKTESKRLTIETRGRDEVRNITDEVARAVRQSGVDTGLATVFVPHSTAAITTIEFEPGAVADLVQSIRRLIPEDPGYRHNRIDDNAHSHLRAALVGPSLAVPVISGELVLGTWQQIVLIDFDTGPRQRTVCLQIIGDEAR